MAPYKFITRVARGEQIEQYGDGTTSRDYTFIDDIVSGVVRAIDRPYLYQIFNLGSPINQVMSYLQMQMLVKRLDCWGIRQRFRLKRVLSELLNGISRLSAKAELQTRTDRLELRNYVMLSDLLSNALILHSTRNVTECL